MVIKLRKTNRGGPRTPIRNKSGLSRLLEVIWNKHGGPVEVADKLKNTVSVIINWRIRGKVPLRQVQEVATILGIPPHGLNYIESQGFLGVKPWEDVVKSYKLSPEEVDWVLRGKRPK